MAKNNFWTTLMHNKMLTSKELVTTYIPIKIYHSMFICLRWHYFLKIIQKRRIDFQILISLTVFLCFGLRFLYFNVLQSFTKNFFREGRGSDPQHRDLTMAACVE